MQRIIFTIIIGTLLSSCSSAIKQKVGLETAAPDELQVEKQRPLYVPPHYELPEPPAYNPLPTKKKSSWMFWKKDKNDAVTVIESDSENIEVKKVSAKKKWFWHKSKNEATAQPHEAIEHKLDKTAGPKKKKFFWQREKKATVSDQVSKATAE